MFEKREYDRQTIKAKVWFKFDQDEMKTLLGEVLDISYLGLGGFFKEKIAVGTIINFDLFAEFLEEHLFCKGEVVHATEQSVNEDKGFKVGVKFIEIDKEGVLELINRSRKIIEHDLKRNMESKHKKQVPPGGLI